MQLITDDSQAGLDTPDGRGFRPDRRGLITLPERDAAYGRRAAQACPLFHIYRQQFAGFDAAELHANYDRWRSEKGHS